MRCLGRQLLYILAYVEIDIRHVESLKWLVSLCQIMGLARFMAHFSFLNQPSKSYNNKFVRIKT